MYKVFFNDCFITLTDWLNPDEANDYQLIHPYKNPALLKEVTILFESSSIENMAILFNDVTYLKKVFFSMFEIIPAAGGVVLNEKNQYLMIYRRGKWDLPKGKTEKNEDIAKTALREVSEETGVTNMELVNKLCDTYHTYKIGTQNVMKETAWYLMKSRGTETLVPQQKEDITKAKWVNKSDVKVFLQNSFGTIRGVFEELNKSGITLS